MSNNNEPMLVIPQTWRLHSHTTDDGIGGNLFWLCEEPSDERVRELESVDGVRYTSYMNEISHQQNYVLFIPYDVEFRHEEFFIKSDAFTVAGVFGSERDRTRYLNDPLTSDSFEPCTEDEVYAFLKKHDMTWAEPTYYSGGTLHGIEVTYSIARDYYDD